MKVFERASAGMLMAVRAIVASSAIPPDRQVTAALYLLVTICNVPGVVAASAYGCTKQNVSKALRAVEWRRDEDPQFDAELARLERIFEEV